MNRRLERMKYGRSTNKTLACNRGKHGEEFTLLSLRMTQSRVQSFDGGSISGEAE
jgi:hypothetical protein